MLICEKCLEVAEYDYMLRHNAECYNEKGVVESGVIELSTYLKNERLRVNVAIEEIKTILHKRMLD